MKTNNLKEKPMKSKTLQKKKKTRLDRIEECILDLALAIESGRISGIYQDCGEKMFWNIPRKTK